MNADEIFVAALDIAEPVQRAEWLQRACAGDEGLRREVDSLLAAHERIGDFLRKRPMVPGRSDTLPVEAVPQAADSIASEQTRAPLTERPGERIGRYKLLEKIGEGGMGVVWMSEQEEPVRRRVALKIIKLGMDTREVVARFEAERQALALMDHPCIAKVFDGGATGAMGAEAQISNFKSEIPQGRPYFVMELVRGLPITKYCDEVKMSTRQRLELFTQVCRAVQHAHQKGIIHRDLKPSNILVTEQDGRPVPKVIDFGIAKATEGRLTDKTLFTGFQQLMGTPAYMSPEQAGLGSLDIDTRSDTYSLGVVLYQLLTGHTPFDTRELLKEGYEAVLRTIREVDPPKPSTRLKQDQLLQASSAPKSAIPSQQSAIDQDLDWIVMKCLEKDRNRRYETPNSLAAELERYLHDEPVQARPPSTGYRLRKFVRKHRAPVAAAAGFVALLVAATAVSVGLALWANRERNRAENAQKSESAQRLVAEAQRNRATTAETEAKGNASRAAESEADTKVFADFLVHDVLATARPEGIQGGLGIEVTVAKAVETAEAALDKTFKNRPRAEATARHAIGVTWLNIGRHEPAERQLRQSLEIREREFAPATPEVWEAQHSYALLLMARARYSEAAQLLERNLELFRNSLPTSLPTPMESVVRGMINLAITYRHMERMADSFKLHQEAVDLATARFGPDARVTWDARSYLASAQFHSGRFEEAVGFYEEEVPWLTTNRGPEHPLTLSSMNNLGLAYLKSERLDKALPLLTNAFNLMAPKFGATHPETMTARDNIARVYEKAGRLREAISLAEENLKLREAALSRNHPDTLGSLLRDGRQQEALPLFQELYDRSTVALGPGHRDTLNALGTLAQARARARDLPSAITLYESAFRQSTTSLGAEDPDTLAYMSNLSEAYLRAGRVAEARPLYEQALRLSANPSVLRSLRSLQALHNVANACRDAGWFTNALTLMRPTFHGYEARLGAGHEGLLRPMMDLGQLLLRAREFVEAEPLLLRAHESSSRRYAQRPSRSRAQLLNETGERLVQLYEAWGQADKAAEWKEKLRSTSGKGENP